MCHVSPKEIEEALKRVVKMNKIIETNLSIDNNGNIRDHQSRVIEVDWDEYVNEIKNAITVNRTSIIGHLYGASVPKRAVIFNFESDDFHLSCDIVKWNKTITQRLAYKIE